MEIKQPFLSSLIFSRPVKRGDSGVWEFLIEATATKTEYDLFSVEHAVG